jgi:hypothetical protein
MRKKSRVHAVNLTEKAEFILKTVLRKYGQYGWFSSWVSNRIIAEFGDQDMDKSFRCYKASELNMKHEKILRELEMLAMEADKAAEKVSCKINQNY